MSQSMIAIAALLMTAGVAHAQRAPFSTIPAQSIFGNSYSIDIHRVGSDFSASPGTGTRLEPEGMVFHDGTLYVSGDGTGSETNGYLAAYAGGDVRFLPSAIGPFSSSNALGTSARFGGEGITVNTRGAGFGSFAGTTPNIVGVDNVIGGVGRQLAVQNLSTTTVQNQLNAFINADDLTFVPGTDASSDRFAILDGTAPIPVLSFFSAGATPTALGSTFALPLGAKGLLYLSAADAALFSTLATGPAILVASSPDGVQTTNRLTLFSLTGTQLENSSLPTGVGAGLFGNIEALAFDSPTRRLFIGDETGASSQIAVLTIPTPSIAALLGLAGLAAARRRRA